MGFTDTGVVSPWYLVVEIGWSLPPSVLTLSHICEYKALAGQFPPPHCSAVRAVQAQLEVLLTVLDLGLLALEGAAHAVPVEGGGVPLDTLHCVGPQGQQEGHLTIGKQGTVYISLLRELLSDNFE